MEDKTNTKLLSKKIKPNPRAKANILSKIFFCWLLPVFYKGYRKGLTEDDLHEPLKEHESAQLGDQLEKAWLQQKNEKKNPSLWTALISVFWKQLTLSAFIYVLIEFVIKLAQPLLLDKLMAYYTPNQTTVSWTEALIYACLIVFFIFLRCLFVNGYILFLMHLGMKMKVSCSSLVYRKAIRLSKSAMAETTTGQMVNLLANDISRFESVVHLNNLWGALFQAVLIIYLMYDRLGVSSVAGSLLLIIFIPFQSWMGKKTSEFRLKTAIKTDERVRLMNEIISGIQVIKMYTWEKPFAKLVELSRCAEMKEIRKNSVIRALTVSFNMFINRFAIYLCILTYVLMGNNPNHQYVFVCTSFYGILQQALTISLPKGVTQIAECNVSIKRLEKFLKHEEVSKKPSKITNGISNNNSKNTIDIKNASTKWVLQSEDNTLHCIDFTAKKDDLVAIVGPVGSGKSTLLHLILKELVVTEGIVSVNGDISYCSQEPWLFSASIRQNILFGQVYNEQKYNDVIRVCALDRDLSLFKFGDKTLVGERGVMLSGGQKARINLARAVYKEADIYLLDDPLSAVDTHVGKQLFDDCICGYLRDKCVVLVTHQLQYLRDVQSIYLLDDGTVAESGSYEQIRNSGKDFADLFKEKTDESEDEEKIVKKQEDEETTRKDPEGAGPSETKEHYEKGAIKKNVYRKYITAGGGTCIALVIMALFVASQLFGSVFDYFITFWVNLEQSKEMNTSISSNLNATQTTNTTGWKDFFTEDVCLIVFSVINILVIVFSLVRSVTFFRFCNAASSKLHNFMFNNIVYAYMKFFNDNPSGRVLNRFSKDIGAVDESLPLTIVDTLQYGLYVLASSLVIGSVNQYILIPTAIMFVIFYILRNIFIKSSRIMKRLEGTTRSPVFTHLSASLQGLTTIRAFGAEDILIREYDDYQNVHSSAYYMFLAANRTFGFWLDMHCVVYVALVTLSFFFIKNEIFGGNVGLAITQSLNLCGKFQWGMRQWSEFENQMTSVERVVEYTDLTKETEKPKKPITPPKMWPEYGNITFDSVYLRYSKEDSYVLKNLNFDIKSEEKVGIVGRTGAGKSSLIAALFRLTDIEGSILIDNINTNTIALSDLRSKIAIIPQEPVLFSGTLRKNLDPFDEYNDNILWSALEDVELKEVVADLPSGLNSKMSEGGSNFSVGQRQLVCLARAIIKKNKILILDEATANVDPQTDSLIQTTIRSKFEECTVLTIAHRLHTIMDSDKVLVMDAGQAVEFDHPYVLLQKEDGVFKSLVNQTGTETSNMLIEIARKGFNGKND